MPMSRLQFQPGLSPPAFLDLFGKDAQCEAALEQARWPEGFRCPERGDPRAYILHVGALGSDGLTPALALPP